MSNGSRRLAMRAPLKRVRKVVLSLRDVSQIRGDICHAYQRSSFIRMTFLGALVAIYFACDNFSSTTIARAQSTGPSTVRDETPSPVEAIAHLSFTQGDRNAL